MKLRLIYSTSPGSVAVWEKTAEELLVPNGDEPLIAWMLREAAARNSAVFSLEVIGE